MSDNLKNQEKNKEKEVISTTNIFDDFEVNEETKKELKEEELKDMFYYFSIIGTFFKYINFVLLFVLFILIIYIYIQQSNEKGGFADNKDYLNPICSILSGNEKFLNSKYWSGECSSISLINSKLSDTIEKKKKDYFISSAILLTNAYKKANVNSSPEIIFLLSKKDNKVRVNDILSDFDILKNKFTKSFPSRIICGKVNIIDNMLETTCNVYSKGRWDKIPGEDINDSSKEIRGTSISFAASFINFLEKEGTFTVLDKQKVFSIEHTFDNGYDYKTEIKLKLKYNNKYNKDLE